jgi:uncharacterized membrane protein
MARPPEDRNVRVIAELERRALQHRSPADRLSDAIVRITGTGSFAAANLVAFAAWILANAVVLRQPFDPYPFNFLTLVVSLEAIFLAIFVLMSQNRMTREADRRAQLDLQVDMLAEQELTTMLHMLHAVCEKLQVQVPVSSERMHQLLHETDVNKLASAIENHVPDAFAPKPGAKTASHAPRRAR